MSAPILRRTLIAALEAVLALALLASLFFQVVVIPTAIAEEALADPLVARSQGALTAIGVLGIACFQAVLVATGMLLLHTWNDSIFSRRPFLWVDVTIGACLVAAGLGVTAALTDVLGPNILATVETDSSTGMALLIVGMAGAAACIAGALVVAVMRDLLKRAVTIRQELDHVI